MFPLSLLSGYLWPAIGIAFAGLLIAVGVQTKRVEWAKNEANEVKAAWVLDRERANEVARKAELAARAREQAVAAAQKESADEYQRQITQARADAVIADAASGRLQQRVAQLLAAARAAPGNPPIVDAGAPAESVARVLAELQRRSDETAGRLALIADERGAAGSACEREYDALTKPVSPPAGKTAQP